MENSSTKIAKLETCQLAKDEFLDIEVLVIGNKKCLEVIF